MSRKFAVFTTFPEKNVYSEKMLQSLSMNWDKNVDIYAYYEGNVPNSIDRVIYRDLNECCPDLVLFKDRHKTNFAAHGKQDRGPHPNNKIKRVGIGFLWDAVRFSHKSYCVFHASSTIDADVVIWLDADTNTFAPISVDFLESLCPIDTYSSYLGRKTTYTECGFVSYNTRYQYHNDFMNCWKNLYDSDEIFNLPEWHDSFLYDVVRRNFEINYGVKNNNISKTSSGHVFINSDLGKYIDHMKGDRKKTGKSKRSDLVLPRSEDYWRSV